jgi:signal transduction histidine kinase
VDVASIDAGKLAIVATVGDAAATVREAVDAWLPNAQAKKVAIQSLEAGRVLARFDSERVLQVLGNLISNAVKFSPASAIVTVGVERIGDEVRFSVRDCGIGIPADELEAVFERFWQIGKDDRRGLGLGLYIAQCIATAHGGRIWAESTLGAGSTFFFTVPASGSAG